MKSTLFTTVLLGLVVNSYAASFNGFVDLTKASNHAQIPTEINAGTYSVDITVEASNAETVNNIQLKRTAYRHDNDDICEIKGSFKVGTATIKVKSLSEKWESTTTQDVFALFGSDEDDAICAVESKNFEGNNDFIIVPKGISLELPVKDTRFTSVQLAINPLVDGFKANYELLAGDNENTLKVLNPGLAFKSSLENSGDKKISYALTLKANGYYHFDTEYTEAKKVK